MRGGPDSHGSRKGGGAVKTNLTQREPQIMRGVAWIHPRSINLPSAADKRFVGHTPPACLGPRGVAVCLCACAVRRCVQRQPTCVRESEPRFRWLPTDQIRDVEGVCSSDHRCLFHPAFNSYQKADRQCKGTKIIYFQSAQRPSLISP